MKRLLAFSLVCLITIIQLAGCCSNGSGSNNIKSDGFKKIGEYTVSSDGRAYYQGDGICLEATTGTFEPNTVITFTKYEDENLMKNTSLLKSLGLDNKDINITSPVFQVIVKPNPIIFNKTATLTIDLNPTVKMSQKPYFIVTKNNESKLVTSQVPSTSQSIRAAQSNKIQLGFISTFDAVSAGMLNKDLLQEDISIETDNSNKILNGEDKYPSDINLTSSFVTLDNIDSFLEEHGNQCVSLNFTTKSLTDNDNQKNKKAFELLGIRASSTANKVTEAKEIVNSKISKQNNQGIFQYRLTCKERTSVQLPRIIVAETMITTKKNIKICSQEHVIRFNPPRRPYVVTMSPEPDSTITDPEFQLDKIVVNFSEPMNTESVKSALTVSSSKITYKASSTGKREFGDELIFNWLENNQKLEVAPSKGFTKDLKDVASDTFIVKIAKTATNASGKSKIAKTEFSEIEEEVCFNFYYSPASFSVVMTNPIAGSINIDPQDVSEITFKFNQPASLTKLLSTKSNIVLSDDDIPPQVYDGNIWVEDTNLTIFNYKLNQEKLNYGTKYTFKLSKNISNKDGKETLKEDYTATFVTKEAFEGKGTQDSPFLIFNRQDLANIGSKKYIDKDYYFKIMNDIDGDGQNSTWIPLGDDYTPFKGHIYGNNKILSNFCMDIVKDRDYDNIGLFNNISDSTIENLTIANSIVCGKTNIGLLTSICKSSSLTNIKAIDCQIKCISDRQSQEENGNNGGLIGKGLGVTLTKCFFECKDESLILFGGSQKNTGGLVGLLDEASKLEDCHVIVPYSTDDSMVIGIQGSQNVGGIVGLCNDSNIIKCSFTGNITTQGGVNVGGIIGMQYNSKTFGTTSITYCSSEKAKIKGTNAVGGIVGSSRNYNIECCKSKAMVNSSKMAGGIVGEAVTTNIYDCYSLEDIVESNAIDVGGIAGMICGGSQINHCYSTNQIRGTDNVGGICGAASDNSEIKGVIALNPEIKGSDATDKTTIHKILGIKDKNVNLVISSIYSLDDIKLVVSGKDAKWNDKDTLNGVKKTVSDINSNFFKGVFENSALWDYSSKYPILK